MHLIARAAALVFFGSTAYAESPHTADEAYDANAHFLYDVVAIGGGGYWEGGDDEGIIALSTGLRFRFDAFEVGLAFDGSFGSQDYAAVHGTLMLGGGVDIASGTRFVALGGASLRNVRFGDPGSSLGLDSSPHPVVADLMPAASLRVGLEHRLGSDYESFRMAVGLWLFGRVDLVERRPFSDTDTTCEFTFGAEEPECESATLSHDIGGGGELGVHFSFSLDFTL